MPLFAIFFLPIVWHIRVWWRLFEITHVVRVATSHGWWERWTVTMQHVVILPPDSGASMRSWARWQLQHGCSLVATPGPMAQDRLDYISEGLSTLLSFQFKHIRDKCYSEL